MGKDNSSNIYKTAGVCFVALICVPLAAAILSSIIYVDWSTIGIVCAILGTGVVICLGIGFIIDIINPD